MTFEMNFKDGKGYEKRRQKSIMITLVFAAFFVFISVTLANLNLHTALLIGIVVFIIQNSKSLSTDKYYIEKVVVKDENVKIIYTEKGIEHTIVGDIKDFNFIKKTVLFNRSRTPYLAIMYKSKPVLKQYRIQDWNETLFDKLVSVKKSHNK